ncbi:acyl-CoA dehydrogenase [Candidatus Hydrogenedentota bacterium]
MSDKLTDMRNIEFLLYEVLDVEELTSHAYFEDHSRETFDMAIDTAYKLAQEVMWPALRATDHAGAKFDGKATTVPEDMHEIWNLAAEGGWMAASKDYDYGGQQFPLTLSNLASFLFCCGNNAAAMYIVGCTGAGLLIESFGSQEQKTCYLEKLYSGEWAGTMALTEPRAGSSLSDITTQARKAEDSDYYMIKGVKSFITSGDHDLTDNIVHPALVRIEGAPPGVKGISLMIVPKFRLDEDGNVGEFNDVTTAGIEDKLGIKLSATATLNFGDNDDCRGWLLGEENKGLFYMFQLLNESRVFTGLQSVALASTAYQCALEYARERIQGRELTSKDPATPPVPIIRHPDVRRMLLQQKAFVEGALGLVLYATKLSDLMRAAENEEDRERLGLLLDVLTPVIKAHFSDCAFESISLAMQCFGGVGYTEEAPIAQLLRDSKVFSIYEGTNGIQALDLLGRKLMMKNGAAGRALMAEIRKTIESGKLDENLKELGEKLEELQKNIAETTMDLAKTGQTGDVNLFLCNATPFLHAFSQMLMSWQWLTQALVARQAIDGGTDELDFYEAKINTARYYINWTTRQALATMQTVKSKERTALDFKEAWF